MTRWLKLINEPLKRAERRLRRARKYLQLVLRACAGIAAGLVTDVISVCPRKRNSRTLVVYLTPGSDVVTGGVMSIESQWREARTLLRGTNAEVLACCHPTGAYIPRYTCFQNDMPLHRFKTTLLAYSGARNLVVHVPEYVTEYFVNYVRSNILLLASHESVIFNIMVQNIWLAPSVRDIDALRSLRFCSTRSG